MLDTTYFNNRNNTPDGRDWASRRCFMLPCPAGNKGVPGIAKRNAKLIGRIGRK